MPNPVGGGNINLLNLRQVGGLIVGAAALTGVFVAGNWLFRQATRAASRLPVVGSAVSTVTSGGIRPAVQQSTPASAAGTSVPSITVHQ